MRFCVLNMEKEFLGTMLRFVKVSGIKSQADFDSIMSEYYTNQNKNLRKFYSEGFAKGLNAIENVIENRKDSCHEKCFSYETISNNAKNKKCFNTNSSENVNSTECLAIIAALSRLKFIYWDMYSNMKNGKMFHYLILYKDRYNIPFEYDTPVSINGIMVGFMEIYFNQMVVMYSKNKEFHMHKKYNFWDWFKSCKNCLAKKMVKKIGSSTIWEIQRWEGSERFIMPYKPAYIPNDADTPLNNYYPLLPTI